MQNDSSPLILIVDDEPLNLQVVGSALKSLSCEMNFAVNAYEALEMIEKRKPDLILLDVMMPGMDGFAVCSRLKAHKDWRDISVLFITAKGSEEDIVRGFELGAIDYITKPFIRSELLSRVRLHLDLHEMNKKLLKSYRVLQAKNDELRELSQLKDEYLSMVAHDFKNPLSVINGTCKYLQDFPESERYSDSFMSELNECLEMCLDASSSMLAQVINVLDEQQFLFSNGDKKDLLSEFDLVEEINKVIDFNCMNADLKKIKILKDFRLKDSQIESDVNKIREIVDNLLSNAIKYSPFGTRIRITLREVSDCPELLELLVDDEGPGFSEEDFNQVFQRFKPLSAKPTGEETSSGLGLYITKKYVDSLGGNISVENRKEGGARFTLTMLRKRSSLEEL